ncbi:hypothetical protein EPUL_003214 [Erysiphe pulchra]|uniref:CCHC-type domain-containing protein n=1 Tax=Erysiphe pulchra TaxID=225359 RepID=A0A2S4PY12_9PEZI|nr:hypothetical protein EPUL_003214 [Erysiphe pulchra]
MRYEVPHSPDTSSNSNQTSYQSFSDLETITNIYQGEDVNMLLEKTSGVILLYSSLWNRDYLIYCPGILSETTRTNPNRVAELFATTENPPAPIFSSDLTVQFPPLNMLSRLAPPRITPYDSTSGNLRTFFLRHALLSTYNIPNEYRAYVAYLREIDSELQAIRSSRRPILPSRPEIQSRAASTPVTFPKPELTVSQGGTAMDLDTISRCKDANGRLTQEAKDARRKLGRCIRCNKPGHIVMNCPLGSRSTSLATTETLIAEDSEQLKE